MSDEREPLSNLVIVSDLHCGCQLGLYPSEPVHLDEGGEYHGSPFQQWLYRRWCEFWDVWLPQAARGEPWSVVINGDTLDGVHHGSVTQVTHNLADQAEIAKAILKPRIEACVASGGRLYITRGTEAHGGASGQEEERLAKELGAVPNEIGQHARYELWIRVGKALCHIMHTIGVSSSAAHESSAINAELSAEFTEAARWRQEPPDYVIRSHRHRCIVVDIDTANGYAASIVTPGWQGKTPFVYRTKAGRVSPPQFGGFLIRQGDVEHYYRRKVYYLERPEEEQA